MRRTASWIAIVLLVASAPLAAATLADVELPDELKVGETVLQLNGLGLREATLLKVDVYVAGLYVESPTGDAAALLASTGPKVLHMHFVRKVGAKDITKAWTEGFEKNAGSETDALRPRLEKLNGWMEDMAKGESMRFTWTGNGAVEVSVKGTPRGTIEGDDFGRALLAVFLGDSPPNPGLKTGLLGG
jgi:hypothetical protein